MSEETMIKLFLLLTGFGLGWALRAIAEAGNRKP